MYNKSKIVMLPTEEATVPCIAQYSMDSNQLLPILLQDYADFINRPGKDGTISPQHLYFLSGEEIKDGDWYYHSLIGMQRFKHEFMDIINEQGLRIIASTDKSLGLPYPNDEFIKEYCEAGGIDEVEVEYEYWPSWDEGVNHSRYILKVSSNNTITIKRGKNSWSRQEVIKLLLQAHKEHGRTTNQRQFKNWIRKNL